MIKRRFNAFLIVSLCLSGMAHAELIDVDEDADASKPPFTLNEAGLTDLGFPSHAAGYTTGNILVVTTNDTSFELFTVDGRRLVDGKWLKAGSQESLRMDCGAMIAKKDGDSSGNLYLISDNGTVTTLPATYRTATNFRDGVAIVRLQGKTKYDLGKSVFIDTKGKQLPSPPGLQAEVIKDINCGVRHIAPLRDGLRAYYDASARKWGYVDAHGKVAIAPTFDQVRSFSDGLAAVVKDSKVFFINKQGEQANPLSWARDWQFSLSDVSDYSGGMCVVNKPSEYPDLMRTYFDLHGNQLGKLRQGSPMHGGTLYYMGDGADGTDRGFYPYESDHIGDGTIAAKKETKWTTYWKDYEIAPRYDEYGVGHTDNRFVTVGAKRPDNHKYKYGYGYSSDFSKAGYAVVFMDTETHSYRGVVDIGGKFTCIISRTAKDK